MSETKQLIEQLNGRVDKLINRISESNQQAEKKQAEIVSLTEQLRQKDQAISALQAEIAELRQAQLAASSVETDELKGRINEMVREIDECISLLNVGN